MDFLKIRERITKELKTNRQYQKEMLFDLNITEAGYRYMFTHKTLKLQTLVEIANWLDKPLCFFLDRDDTHLFREDSTTISNNKRINNLETKVNLLVNELNKR